MERMDGERLVKKINGSDGRGVRLRGKTTNGMDGHCEERALDARGMSVEQGRVVARDRDEWKAVVCA